MAVGSAAVLAEKLSLDDLDVDGRRVLVRADLNLPVQDGEVTDDTRLVATLPTLEALIGQGAALVVMSHRGRPKGKPEPDLGMEPVARAMAAALDRPVELLADCVGDEVEGAVTELERGEVVLLENLRFHAGETANDPSLAQGLAGLADFYVNDAFAAAHRAHASIVGVPPLVEAAAAGRLLVLEVTMLSRCLDAPGEPFVLVAGGAKVSDKLEVLRNLMPLVDRLIVGGAMANALLAAGGSDMGRSRIEEGSLDLAGRLLTQAAEHGVEVLLPVDFVVAESIDAPADARVVTEVPADAMALDIGPETAERFAAGLTDARTVLWNGPMGVFEQEAFARGTFRLGEAIASIGGALTIVGGGDTAAAAAASGVAERMSHVSTGGGAALDLLSGVVLPGVAALTDKA